MGRLRDGTQKVSHEDEHEHEGLDDVDEYGYSVAFITEKYASLAHQTGGHVQLVHVTKKREEELGVKLVAAKNARNNWAFVSEIAKKSPAEKTKQLKVGDQLLEINGKTLYGRTLLQVTNLLKTHQQNAKLSIVALRRKDAQAHMATEAESKAMMDKEASMVANFNDMLSAPTKGPTNVAVRPTTTALPSSQQPSTSKAAVVQPVAPTPSTSAGSSDVVTVMEVQKASSNNKIVDEPAQQSTSYPPRQKRPALPPGSIKACVLQKEVGVDLGFAFYGKPQPDDPSKQDIFITKISPGTVAWLEGSLENGDQILGINDKIFVDVANVDEAKSILDRADGDVEVIYRKKPHLLKNKALPTNYATMIQHARQGVAPQQTGDTSPKGTEKVASLASNLPVRAVPFLDYNPRKNDVKANEETWIMIDKGLHNAEVHVGISVVGGSHTEMKYVVINGIFPDSPAAKDGRLRAGDVILQIDEWDMRNASHHQAMNRLHEAKRQIYLLVRRDRHGIYENKLNDVFTVDLVKRPGHGLGICIGARPGGGVYVTRLIGDSEAVNDGRLAVDDVLLEMNGTNLRDMDQMEVATLLKMSMGLVVLTVARSRWRRVHHVVTKSELPKSPATEHPPFSISMLQSHDSVDVDMPQSRSVFSFITDQIERARRQRIAYRRYRSRSRSISPGGTFTSTSSGGSAETPSSPTNPLQSIVHWLTREHDYIVENQYEVFDVTLKCNAQGEIGLQIFNGEQLDQSLMRVRGASPFVVANMTANEPAKQSNMIKVGDILFSVNEQLVSCMTRNEVLELLKGEAGSTKLLRFERACDEAVVAKVPRLPVEAPLELTIRKTTVHRGSATLGLSLVGGLDEKTGLFLPFQIKSLIDNGAALKAGVKPGDCVLAVNDIALDGLAHEKAVYLLKRAQGQALLTLITF